MSRALQPAVTALLAAACAWPTASEAHDPGHAAPAAPCLAAAAWHDTRGEKPRPVAASELLADMARRDVVLLGEQHDAADHHRWQLQTLAVLHALRPRMAIGFEFFPRRLQPVLDRWVAGDLTLRQFLEQSEWDRVASVDPALYAPLFEFARMNRIPMVALNVEAALIDAVSDKGFEAVPQAQREGVTRPAPPAPAYRAFLLEIFGQHGHGAEGGKPGKDTAASRRFVDSQQVWDRAMAQALAARATVPEGQPAPLVVGLMGMGHVQHGYGVPHQLRDLGVKRIGTLLPIERSIDCALLEPGIADAVFAVPDLPPVKPEPPRLGVLLDQEGEAVRVKEVTAGSLAEKTGLRAGDRVVAVAGAPARSVGQVIAAVRRQPEGTMLPMKLLRGEETLELVVRFPAKP